MKRILVAAATFGALLATPIAAIAEDSKSYDGRLDDLPKAVTLDSGSTGLLWLLVVALAVVGLGVLFHGANRSHLD